MPSYSGEGSGGPRHSGYAVIGPPFVCEKTFERVNAGWAGGRVTATFTGTIQKPLSYPVMSYDGQTEHRVPEEAVGERIWMYLEHQIDNHTIGDDEDSYRWLPTSWSKKGRPFASFWTAWVLAHAGFSTRDLSHKDNDQLALELQAALNAGGSWAAPIRDSTLRDFQKPIPPGEEAIAVFHQMPYVNWRFRPARPTWVKYTSVTNEGQERTVREVIFLLRVVAPEQWRGVLLPLRSNYTLIHGQKDGVDMWDKTHVNATFDSVLRKLGVSNLNEFFEDIPEERLYEHDLGEIVNVLDYAETALIRAVEMGHTLHVVVPAEGWMNREAIQPATQLNVQRLAGDGFVVPVLKTVKELGPITSEPEPIPGFGEEEDATGYLSMAEVVSFLNNVGRTEIAKPDGTFVVPEGVEWMERFILPLFQVLGLNRNAPFDGWTTEFLDKARLVLQDESYLNGCRRDLDDEEALAAIVEYAKSRLDVEEEADAEPTTAF